MGFSTADLTLLRIRCDACKQYTERLVTLLLRRSSMTCVVCKATIDLTTPHNVLLIKETARRGIRRRHAAPPCRPPATPGPGIQMLLSCWHAPPHLRWS